MESGLLRAVARLTPPVASIAASMTASAMAAAFLTAALSAQAQQKFPSRPVRVVVPNPAGSQGDMLTRMIGQKLSERWGQPVVVDNRTGGVGTVAGSTVVKATPDGHTLLQTAGFPISAVLQTNLPYDPLKDFAGVSQIGIGTQVLVVAPALGARSVKEFIALAKSRPGKIIYGSSAVGTGSHLNGIRFALAAGIKVVTVAFKGGPEATVELMAGRTHLSSVTLFSALPHVNDGRLVALAVATPQRSPLLPDVPALAETMPDFKRPENTTGMLAPAGTPRPVLSQISKDIAHVLDLPDVKERLQGMGYVTAPTTPEEFDSILRGQIETLAKVVREAGLRPK
jgi:tripartite-type tricarboxylate transporter receptor subunit TctC